jgi:hypothetical protein
MFDIVKIGPAPGMPRLVAPVKLQLSDFAKVAKALGAKPFKATKTGFVAARIAKQIERVETRWNGNETQATAEPGDAIVSNMSPNRQVLRDTEGHTNTYVIRRDKFPELYEAVGMACEHGDIFRPKASVEALYLQAGFELMAPWGEIQTADSGYLIKNGGELYGNNKATFEATYQRK